MIKKYVNSVGLGFSLGIIGPWLGFWLYSYIKFNQYTFVQYCTMVMEMKELQSPILSLSLVFNLLTFFLFIKLNKDKSARGILFATIVYIPVVVFLRFY